MRSVQNMMDLTGRKALVTGGAGYIGKAVSESLVELGATVAVLDRDKAACDNRVSELCSVKHNSAISICCNLQDEVQTRESAKLCVDLLGGLDIFVHLAAYVGTTKAAGWAVPFNEQTVAAWDAALRVNLTSAFILVQETYQDLSKSGNGAVILFGSTYALSGQDLRLYEGTDMVNPSAYGASKAALLQLTRHLATTFAPSIRVNSISPGGVWRNQPESFRSNYVARAPLGRMATEQDLKGAVAFLASDLSQYVTGHNLMVDGGWSAW